MGEALKKESSVLDEFEIPEHFGEVVEGLKKEQTELTKELEKTKSAPVVRKQDESTRVFNLRQHQIELKIAELEEKKKKTEQELQTVLQQKNTRLHDDLKKLAQIILQETRKFSSFEKDLNTRLGAVTNLRNELQQVLEANLNDRKKNVNIVEEQTKQLNGISEQVRETSRLLQTDFHFLSKDVERLHSEKQEKIRALAGLKEEVSRYQGVLSELTVRKEELKVIEQKISEGERNAVGFSRLDEELEKLRTEVSRLQEEKDKLTSTNNRLQQDNIHKQDELSRLLVKEKQLDHVIAGKKQHITSLEEDVLDVRKRLEFRRNEEHELHQKYLHRHDQLASLHEEIGRLEGKKLAEEKMMEETKAMFEEKRAFLTKEMNTLVELHQSKLTDLSSQYEMKKTRWEEEFHHYTENRKVAFQRELDEIAGKDLEEIRRKKKEFLHDIVTIMSSLMSAEGFSSSEERSVRAKKDVEKTFQTVFGKTRRWSFW